MLPQLNAPRSCLLKGFFVLACMPSARAGDVAPSPMPFIEIDPSATTHFRERDTHKPFVAIGVNYFDPQVGWAPQLWKRFDEQRVREHLDRIHGAGFNTIRIFLTFTCFHSEKGQLDPAGMAKLRTLLLLCRERSIYVILTGPESWEGTPSWRRGDPFADEEMLDVDDTWWRSFAHEMRDEPTLLAYDLINEPTIGWDTPSMRQAWQKYSSLAINGSVPRGADSATRAADPASLAIPRPAPGADATTNARLLAFQHFREVVGQNWTRRKVTAIRSVDPNHMVTVGHIQWAAPNLLPSVAHYAGFDLKENVKLLDFMTIHFYPLDWPKPCDAPNGVAVNKAYLQAVLFEASVGKPVMLGEFGWHGGGDITENGRVTLPAQSVQDQLNWGRELIGISRGHVCGWVNWAFADTPESRDLTRWSGCWTSDLQMKPWGVFFSDFARQQALRPDPPRPWPAFMQELMNGTDSMKISPDAGNRARLQLRAAMSP